MKGKFIVFEGVDHVGKTTQMDRAEEYLKSMKLPVLRYREPGGTKVGERIRDILLDKDLTIHPKTELMLFFAARMQLIWEHIEAEVSVAGKIVLLDRYYYSTAAYQGPFIQGYGTRWVLTMAEEMLKLPEPDLVIYLDGDPEQLARRAAGEKADRIEAKGLDYQRKVREAYLSMAEQRPIFKTVNAMKSVDDVWNSVRTYLDLLISVEAQSVEISTSPYPPERK